MKKNKRKASRGKRTTAKVCRRDMPELQLARSLWSAKRFPESLSEFQKAVRKQPHNLNALLDAARAFGSRFEFAQAEKYLSRILALDGNAPLTLHQVGQSYRMIYRPDNAIACFEQAVDKNAELADTHLELAILWERRHRLAESESHITACLKLKPDYAEAQFVKARILARSNQAAEARALLLNIVNSDNHWLVTSQAWAELASLSDAEKDYAGAMDAIGRSKQILSPQASPYRRESARSYRHLNNLCGQVRREDFRSWQSQLPAARQRIALLTGIPRSGTTLLEKILDAHPDILTSDERPVFPRYIYPAMLNVTDDRLLSLADLQAIPRDTQTEARARYLRYVEGALQEPIGNRLLIDKNPSMTMLIPAFLRLFPESRIIFAIRDPRDVVLSCFHCNLPLNAVSVNYLTLADTVEQYCAEMTAWLRLRDELTDNVIEVRYEDLVDDFATSCRTVLDYLEVSWDDAVRNYRERLASREVNSPTYAQVARPIYRTSIGKWQSYEQFLAPYFERLAPFVAALGYRA